MQENFQDRAGDNAVRSAIGISTIRTASEVQWKSRDWPVSTYWPQTHFLTATAVQVQTMTGRRSGVQSPYIAPCCSRDGMVSVFDLRSVTTQ